MSVVQRQALVTKMVLLYGMKQKGKFFYWSHYLGAPLHLIVGTVRGEKMHVI
jgi:hypothetical protein